MELEIQNEELRQAQIEWAESRDRYSDRYELAPVGYITLHRDGRSLRANLRVTAMLDIDRRALVVDAAADEQRRIGQDIHDGVGQELTGLRYMAQTHAEILAEEASPEAKTAERMTQWLETIQRQLRAVIRELIPVDTITELTRHAILWATEK